MATKKKAAAGAPRHARSAQDVREQLDARRSQGARHGSVSSAMVSMRILRKRALRHAVVFACVLFAALAASVVLRHAGEGSAAGFASPFAAWLPDSTLVGLVVMAALCAVLALGFYAFFTRFNRMHWALDARRGFRLLPLSFTALDVVKSAVVVLLAWTPALIGLFQEGPLSAARMLSVGIGVALAVLASVAVCYLRRIDVPYPIRFFALLLVALLPLFENPFGFELARQAHAALFVAWMIMWAEAARTGGSALARAAFLAGLLLLGGMSALAGRLEVLVWVLSSLVLLAVAKGRRVKVALASLFAIALFCFLVPAAALYVFGIELGAFAWRAYLASLPALASGFGLASLAAWADGLPAVSLFSFTGLIEFWLPAAALTTVLFARKGAARTALVMGEPVPYFITALMPLWLSALLCVALPSASETFALSMAFCAPLLIGWPWFAMRKM